MDRMKNTVAVDWRSGPDLIYFFFKDTKTYSRVDMAEREVMKGHPTTVDGHWDTFSPHVDNLRFGFTTTSLGWNAGSDEDIAWLFYTQGDTPMVCKYNQDTDTVAGTYRVANSLWAPILPYFYKIIAGTWWETVGYPSLFKFLLNDGHYLTFNFKRNSLTRQAFTTSTGMRALAPYANRIVTAAQYDRTLSDSHLYIFLTGEEYLVYNIPQNRLVQGPSKVSNATWPGLLTN